MHVYVCACLCVAGGEGVVGSAVTDQQKENQYHEESAHNNRSHYLPAHTSTFRSHKSRADMFHLF